jgi:cyclopropane-fatty-acyl-phospholipid synthase
MENLREHYALTLRHWVRNLEENWDDAVAQVGVRRARIWRLYMAGSAVSFEDHEINIDQVLAVNTPSGGASGFPLRPEWSSMRDRTSGRD